MAKRCLYCNHIICTEVCKTISHVIKIAMEKSVKIRKLTCELFSLELPEKMKNQVHAIARTNQSFQYLLEPSTSPIAFQVAKESVNARNMLEVLKLRQKINCIEECAKLSLPHHKGCKNSC